MYCTHITITLINLIKYSYKGFNYLGNGKYESVQRVSDIHQPPPAYGATDNA